MFNSIPFIRGGVALIIMPLNVIEEGQTAGLLQIKDHAKCSPVILNGDSNTSELRADIQRGCYSHSSYSCAIFIDSLL